MKKKFVLLFCVLFCFLCLFMTACSNEFAAEEYEDNNKISQNDRYAKEMSVFNIEDGGYSFTASKFNGRETLWTQSLKTDQDLEIHFKFSLSNGRAKVVHVDGKGNVTTLIECTPDTSTDGFVTKTVSLSSGRNRLKIVGYDCEDIDLTMLFDEG